MKQIAWDLLGMIYAGYLATSPRLHLMVIRWCRANRNRSRFWKNLELRFRARLHRPAPDIVRPVLLILGVALGAVCLESGAALAGAAKYFTLDGGNELYALSALGLWGIGIRIAGASAKAYRRKNKFELLTT